MLATNVIISDRIINGHLGYVYDVATNIDTNKILVISDRIINGHLGYVYDVATNIDTLTKYILSLLIVQQI